MNNSTQAVYGIFILSMISYGIMLYNTKKHPNITLFERSNNTVRVSWRSHPNNLYSIQTTTNIMGQNWYTIGVTTGGPGNTSSKIITISNDYVRFYRIKDGIESHICLNDCSNGPTAWCK